MDFDSPCGITESLDSGAGVPFGMRTIVLPDRCSPGGVL